MGGYHDIVLPDKYSQGSQYSVGYDTRVTTLESGIETRMAKYRPEGRRRYSVLKGIASTEDILELYEFYMLRQGALNSFKMRDWVDYSTSPTREQFSTTSVPITAFDMPLAPINGRTYQMATLYEDAARTIIRTLSKIRPNTEKISVNGVELLASEYTINYETGLVDINASVGQIASIRGGCEFYVVVRFAEETDQAFTVAMQATLDTQSIPGFDLIEDVSPDSTSQDYQYGGSHFYTSLDETLRIVEVQGRLQSITTTGPNAQLILPQTFNIPDGGPIFVLHNSVTSSDPLPLLDAGQNLIATIGIGQTVQCFLTTPSGVSSWVVLT